MNIYNADRCEKIWCAAKNGFDKESRIPNNWNSAQNGQHEFDETTRQNLFSVISRNRILKTCALDPTKTVTQTLD